MKIRLTALCVLLTLALSLSFLIAQPAYQHVQKRLSEIIQREMDQKQLPAVYVALVDGSSIVWARAFGYSDPERKVPATVEDALRIASVSKLFTDIGIMQMVERGKLDLDVPVEQYLPDFHPDNPFDLKITLRQLMSHRAGLVREPPVGNYFDPTEPSLAETISSLNRTALVYQPETRFKYSNAGVAVAGYVLQHTVRKPFSVHMQDAVLTPMDLTSSSFDPQPDLRKRKPRAFLWTYDGRVFDAPSFQFGMGPAINMYSTIGDLGKFMMCLFNGGQTAGGRILRKETVEEMWRPQFTPAGGTTGVGLGFFLSELDGHRQFSHSGDVYGFATEFAGLPDLGVGVIVVNTMNAANAWSSMIARYALRLIAAGRMEKELPEFPYTTTVDADVIRKIQGTYKHGSTIVDLFERNGNLFMQGSVTRVTVRQHENGFMVDDKISHGTTLQFLGNRLIAGHDTLEKAPVQQPDQIPEKWKGLVGEYGWDHNTMYIQERNGVLHAQIEWYFSYPLTEISPDSYRFPDYGLYHGEKLFFQRNGKGIATEVTAAGVVFRRRLKGMDDGSTFVITPLKPIEEVRSQALRSSPPKEAGEFMAEDLVELTKLDSTIRLDIRYASTNNFMKSVFYPEPRAFMQRPAAEAVVRANRWLRQFGYGLLVYDAYRPWYVTKMFWESTPSQQHDFVADPSKGSRHNRGCAVDIGLYDLSTGKPAPMVSGYDEFSVRAYPDYPGGTSLQRWNRELLRSAMHAQGFEVYVYEWWHFDYKDWQRYPIMNVTFDHIN